MTFDQCKSCGGDLERIGNYYVCKFCGNKWMIDADNDVHVIDRANAWSALRDCDFERAVELFENIIFKDPDNHEAYWGRALASAGIMYVTDLNEHKKVPTCNNIREESFVESNDVKKAISLAPQDIAETYKKQSEQIEAIRVEWVKKASKEKPYDIFICYKDSDREHNIERTDDSYDAQELYLALTEEGYRVFFSRVSLRNKVAEHYEPYIYNALKTAKVMIVFGEKTEYFNAVWVKNEWTRFRAMIERGEKDKNSLVTVYKNIFPNDLPAGLRSRQSLDAAEIKFFDILKNHIDKIINAPKERTLADDFVPEPPKKKKKIPIFATIACVLALSITLGVVTPNFINLKNNDTEEIKPETTAKATESNTTTDSEPDVESDNNNKGDENEDTPTPPKIVNITFNANGGSGTMSAQIITVGESATLKECSFTNDGYTFGGWATSAGTIIYTNGATFQATSESEITLYAIWVPNSNLIVFNSNGGSGSIDSISIKTNESITLPSNSFTKTGYTFAGWSETKDGSVKYSDSQSFTMTSSATVTLYAVWSANTNTISLNANGGTVNSSSLTVTYDSAYTLPTPTKTGYAFNGWYNGSTKVENGTWNYTTDLELVASWTIKSYNITYEDVEYFTNAITVTYDYNYTGSTPDTVILSNGSKLDYPPIPERNGYVFAGWYTNSSCTTAYSFKGSVTENITLYSKWIVNEKSNVINVGSSTSVSLSSTKQYYAFVPLVSGEITVYTTDKYPSNYTTSGYLYDSSLTQLVYKSALPGQINFSYTYSVTAGTLYYIGVDFTTNAIYGSATLHIDGTSVPDSSAMVSCSSNSGYIYNTNKSHTASVTYGADFTLPTPIRTGYTFTGWYYGSTKVESGTWTIDNDNVILIPGWTTSTYTLTLDGNGVTVDSASKTIAYGDEFTLPTLTRTGYVFNGWYNGATKVEGGTWNYTTNIALTASWTANTNTINFNSNGGSGSMAAQQAKTDEKVTLNYNSFTREGYTFAGWATSSTGSVAYADGATYTMGSGSSYTLYAIWIKAAYTITYHMNGGSNNVNNPAGYDVTDGTITFANPTRDGYTFLGWYTDAAFQNKITSIPSGSTGNKVVYASWSANTNTINFNSNGGSGTMAAQQAKTDEKVTLNYNSFSREGYTFAGWATSSTGSVAYADGATYTMGSGSSYTLYAIWIKAAYTITYHMNGGSNNANNPTGYNVDTTTITLADPERDGYTFLGWYTDAAFQNKITSIVQGSTGNKDIYASWSANTNTINFNANGGSGSMTAQQAKTDEKVTLKQNSFTRTGYTFKGWSTSSDGVSVYADKAQYTMGSNASVTLYAVWEANTNTINFDANGGSGSMTAQQAKTNEKVTLKSNSFTRAGYTFKGWSTTAGGSVSYVDTAYYTMGTNASVTLYAVWEANTNTINFNANGGSGSMSSQKATTGANITLNQNSFKREGYTFKGWSTSVNGSVVYNNGASYTMGTAASATLYAVWEYGSEGLIYEGSAVVGYTGTDKNVYIPAKYNGTTITTIGKKSTETEFGFYNNTQIEKIVLPDTITTIGYSAFNGCRNLKEINLPSTVTFVHANAFTDCVSLQNIFIPKSCINMGSYAFAGCTSLTIYCESNSFAEANGFNGWAGNWNATGCTVYWGAIRDGVKVEFDYAGATSNTSTEYKFVETGKSYTLPVPTKTGYTFGGWYYGTTQITNATGATLSTWNISSDCTLSAKWDPATNTAYTVKHYQENANDNGYTLKDTETLYGTTDSTVSPSTKTYTGFNAPSKASVKILPDGSAVLEYHYTRTTSTVTFVTNGGNAMDSMTVKYQQTPVLPNAIRNGFSFGGWFKDDYLSEQFGQTAVTSDIVVYAWWTEENKPSDFRYYGTSEITISGYEGSSSAMNIPTYIAGVPVTSIANHAFQFCNTITSVVMSKNISVIGDNAFYGCDSLVSVVIPNSVLTIGGGAFCDCDVLAIIEIPDSVTSIGDWAFGGCVSLTNISIGNSVEEIGQYCFSGCSSLEAISFPSSLRIIGADAFVNTGITTIHTVSLENWLSLTWLSREGYSDSTPFTTGYNLYVNGLLLEELVIPETATQIDEFAFFRCFSLKAVYLHNNITDIAVNAFGGCFSLDRIYYDGTLQQYQELSQGYWYWDMNAEAVQCFNAIILNSGEIIYTLDEWDGTVNYSFAGGTGTEEDPYLISTAEQLAYVATAVNQGVDTFKGKYLKLTKDLHLMNLEWTPIGTNYSFEGTFNGDGYNILGLRVTDTNLRYSGLFGSALDAKFLNVIIKDAYVNNSTGYGTGILVGYALSHTSSSLIENCVVEGTIISYRAGTVGGIVGSMYGTVSKSYANVSVYGSSYVESGSSWRRVYVGGIAGSAHKIENCWSSGSVTATGIDLYRDLSYAGGIAGMAEYIGSCYSTANVESKGQKYSYAGGIVGKAIYSTITIENSFSVGSITGDSYSSHDIYCGRIIAETADTMEINNCYADSLQTINYNSNSYGTLQFTQILQSENFIYNTLGWSSDIWQINEGGFPTLK